MRQKSLTKPRSPSFLCLTCINHAVAVEPGCDARGARRVCGAGVKYCTDRYACDSYVRLFAVVPFLTERRQTATDSGAASDLMRRRWLKNTNAMSANAGMKTQ